MKNKVFAHILLASILSTSTSFAQNGVPSPEPDASIIIPPAPSLQPNEPDVGKAISPMKRSQQAPFTGVLLSPAAVASIIADINRKNEEIKIEVDKATKSLTAKHEFEVNTLKLRNDSDAKVSQIRIDGQRKEIDRLDAQLKKEQEDRPNPITWLGIGLGTGVILSTLTAAAVVYVTRQ